VKEVAVTFPFTTSEPEMAAEPVNGNPSIPVSCEPSPMNSVAITEPVTARDPVILADPVNGNPSIPDS
jgi:hypothetical protein